VPIAQTSAARTSSWKKRKKQTASELLYAAAPV
jgi:hypothetical protein